MHWTQSCSPTAARIPPALLITEAAVDISLDGVEQKTGSASSSERVVRFPSPSPLHPTWQWRERLIFTQVRYTTVEAVLEHQAEAGHLPPTKWASRLVHRRTVEGCDISLTIEKQYPLSVLMVKGVHRPEIRLVHVPGRRYSSMEGGRPSRHHYSTGNKGLL